MHTDSAVAQRMVMYGRAVDELHIIVACEGSDVQLGDNVFVHPTGTSSLLSRISSIVRTGKNFKGVTLITAQDPFEYGIAGLRLGKILNVPVELQVHTDIGSPHFLKDAKNKVRMVGIKQRLKKAVGVRVVSERVAHAVERLGVAHKHITVLPMYIDIQRFTSITNTPTTREQSILMVGRLEKEKEYPTAFRAFARVLKRFPDARLYIAGEGRLHTYLLSQTQKHNIGHAITFLGAVSDVVPHLTSTHVFLHTSSYEGFGAVIAEAALVGVPLVSTDVGIAGTVLRDEVHGRVVKVGDVGAISDAIIETLTYPQRAHERTLGAAGTMAQYLLSSEEYIAKLKAGWDSIIT